MSFKSIKLEDYIKRRDAGVNVGFNSSQTKNEDTNPEVTVAGSDSLGHDFNSAEYDKLLNFLRGKKTISNAALGDKPLIPKEAAKGWFIVDENNSGYWIDGGWTQDPVNLQHGIINSEEVAKRLAGAVGGVVIPAEEILG